MAWGGVWHHIVDGLELNDWANGLVCDVPETQDLQEVQHVFVPIAGGHPVWHRAQPLSGRFTFMIHALKDDDPDWDSKLAAIKAVMAQDVPHTYQYQVRGMASPATVQIVIESVAVDDYKQGRLTVSALAADPRPA